MASSWFAFFGRDFLASTLGWSAEERGHYVTLLIAQWEQDGLPADMKRLELISPGVGKAWKTVGEKFPVGVGGKRRNIRMEHERHLSHERSERARQSASARWAGRAAAQAPEVDIPAQNDDSECVEQCSEQCDRICDGICPAMLPCPCLIHLLLLPRLRRVWMRMEAGHGHGSEGRGTPPGARSGSGGPLCRPRSSWRGSRSLAGWTRP